MSGKQKVHLQYSDDMEAVDTALSEAMAALDERNERVADLLRTFEPPTVSGAEPPAPEASGTEGGESVPEAAGA